MDMLKPESLWKGQGSPYWTGMLQHPEGEVRWQAIDALRHIDPPSKTIPLFIAALSDDYWRARALAAHALYDMAYEEELIPLLRQVILPLADALKDESPHVRLNATHTLGLLGPASIAAMPALIDAVEHGDEEPRRAAAEAVRQISGRETAS